MVPVKEAMLTWSSWIGLISQKTSCQTKWEMEFSEEVCADSLPPPQTWRPVPISTPLRFSNQSSGIREFCWQVPEFTGHAVFAPEGLFLNRVSLCPRLVTCQASCSLVQRKALSREVTRTRPAVLRRCPKVGDL